MASGGHRKVGNVAMPGGALSRNGSMREIAEATTVCGRGSDRGSRVKKKAPGKLGTIGGDASESIGQAFSDIELLAAADVIKAAISEGRKHVDQEALKRVLAKLTAAYQRKSQAAAAKQ